MEYRDILRKAIHTFGVEPQKRMAVEECAELINALAKESRGRSDIQDIVTEIADVRIMCDQLAMIYGEGLVEAEIERKIERLCLRLTKR